MLGKPLLPTLLLVLAGCGGADDRTLSVYAAASLRGALEELDEAFEREHGATVRLNVAGSGTLAIQIEQGGACDVFLSAGTDEVDRLEERGRVVAGSRVDLLSNRLVLVVPRGETGIRAPADLLEREGWISIASPGSVPAGRYARAWLLELGLWEALRERVLPGANARAALAAVESGSAVAGIVYRTDAATSGDVDVVHESGAGSGVEIRYPAAILEGGGREELARAYLAHLASADAARVFRERGFVVLGERSAP